MRREVVHHQRPGRHRQLGGHRQQLPVVVEFVGDDLGDLADGELLVVAAVEDLAHRRLGLIDGEQQRVRQVVDVAERDQAQPVVGQDDERAAGRGCAARRTTPAARAAAARRRTGSGSASRWDGSRTAAARCGRCGSSCRRRPRWPASASSRSAPAARGAVHRRVEESAVDGHPADRQQPADAALQHVGDAAQPAVAGDRDVEGLVARAPSRSPSSLNTSPCRCRKCATSGTSCVPGAGSSGRSPALEPARDRPARSDPFRRSTVPTVAILVIIVKMEATSQIDPGWAFRSPYIQ